MPIFVFSFQYLNQKLDRWSTKCNKRIKRTGSQVLGKRHSERSNGAWIIQPTNRLENTQIGITFSWMLEVSKQPIQITISDDFLQRPFSCGSVSAIQVRQQGSAVFKRL